MLLHQALARLAMLLGGDLPSTQRVSRQRYFVLATLIRYSAGVKASIF